MYCIYAIYADFINKTLFNFYTNALAVIGYEGDCKPDWVTDVKNLHDSDSGKGDVAVARVALPTRPVCDG